MTQRRELQPPLARALIRALTRGTAVADGARFIHVGQNAWLDAQLELLTELEEDGTSDTKFVRGAYGAGKSHFLSVVQDFARERNWMTAHVECKVDRVEIDRFETLYPAIAAHLLVRDMPASEGMLDPFRYLLESWATKVLRKAGVREEAISRPFDADERVYGQFRRRLLRSGLPSQFVQALMAFARAELAADHGLTAAVCAWMKGGQDSLSIPANYLNDPKVRGGSMRPSMLRPIGKGTASDAMRGLLWLVRDTGYAGLVLCIDEVEELARLGNQKRQDQALQALREFVDHAGGEGGYRGLCMYLAATPEMFESDRYFPRYDALATRIQPVGDAINWRGPVIDLDRTLLGEREMLDVAQRIMHVYATAYGSLPKLSSVSECLEQVVSSVMASRYRLAKPRLLARVLVDELERMRSEGPSYRPPGDLSHMTSRAASAVMEGQGN